MKLKALFVIAALAGWVGLIPDGEPPILLGWTVAMCFAAAASFIWTEKGER